MTNEEIKKALSTCAEISCDGCPYDEHSTICCYSCSDKLKLDACALITEQEQDIKQLKAENIRLTTKLGQVLLSIDTVKEMDTMRGIDEQRKHAVQEFADKLKEKYSLYDDRHILYRIIDELLKEYGND